MGGERTAESTVNSLRLSGNTTIGLKLRVKRIETQTQPSMPRREKTVRPGRVLV